MAARVPGATKTLSREHSIFIEHSNLVTVTGGKWTTYRRMAVDALAQAARCGLIPAARSTTETLRIDVSPALEAARAAAFEARDGQASALLRYRDLARACEQARTASDLIDRRLRIGLIDRRRAAELIAALA